MCPDIPVFSLTQTQVPSVIVWIDDSGVAHARDTKTGSIIAESADHASVLQAALNALSGVGGRVFVKSGEYRASAFTYLTVPERVAIEGEVGREGKPVLHLMGFKITNGWCRIENVRLVDDAQTPGSKAIYINQDASPYGHAQRVTIRNVEISKFDYGIINDNVNKATFGIFIRDVRSECRSGDLWLYYSIPTIEFFIADHANYAQTLDDYAVKIIGTGPLGGGGYLNHVEAMSAKKGIYIGDHLQLWADFLHADLCSGEGITVENCQECVFRMPRAALNGGYGLGIGSCQRCTFTDGLVNANNGHGISMGTAPGASFGCKGVAIIGFHIFDNKNGGIVVYAASADNYSIDIFVDDCILYNNGTGTTWANIHAYAPSRITVGKAVCRGGSGIPLGDNVTVVGQVVSDAGLAKNAGTATIPAGSTSATVNHGLLKAPSKVLVTPAANLGAVWVSNITSTQFTINCSTAPSSDTVVYWYAEV